MSQFTHAGFPGFTSLFNVAADGRLLFQLPPRAIATANPVAAPAVNPAAQAPITVIVNWAGNRGR